MMLKDIFYSFRDHNIIERLAKMTDLQTYFHVFSHFCKVKALDMELGHKLIIHVMAK